MTAPAWGSQLVGERKKEDRKDRRRMSGDSGDKEEDDRRNNLRCCRGFVRRRPSLDLFEPCESVLLVCGMAKGLR
jgi:hypothetical protein